MSTSVKLNKTSFFSHKAITIPAGLSLPVQITGQFFVCKECTAKFTMTIGDGGEKIPMEVGLGFRMEGQDGFDSLTFYNDSQSDIDVEFYAGVGEIKDARLNTLVEREVAISQKDFPTRIKPYSATIPLNGIVAFPGTDNGNQRKQVVVTNLATNLDIQVTDGDGNPFDTIFPRSSKTYFTNADIKVKNINGQGVDVQVAQFFYTA